MAKHAPLSNTSPLPSLLFPSVLYPSLADLENYMGLSLSSQEVQQNLLQLPEGAGVGILLLPDVGTEMFQLALLGFAVCTDWKLLLPGVPAALFLDGTSHFDPSLKVLWGFLQSWAELEDHCLPLDLWLRAAG